MKTPWYDVARAELGQREVAGKDDNPRILEYYAGAGFPGIEHDETAWCAAFANWSLNEAGFPITRSLMAKSFLGYGKACKPTEGCIVVLDRGTNPAEGHVGFLSHIKGGRVYLLGGNQGDKVAIESFPETDVRAYRLPSEVVKLDRKVLGTAAAGSGVAAAEVVTSLPPPPDLAALGQYKAFGEQVSSLGSWAWDNWLLTAGLALWIAGAWGMKYVRTVGE